jgi:cell division septal protein FtsQ
VADEPKGTPEDVPDVVLEELLAAFSDKHTEQFDFDDPSIDRLLGLGDDEQIVDDDDEDLGGDGEEAAGETTDDGVWSAAALAEPRAEPTESATTSPTDTVALAPSPKLIVIGGEDDDRPDALYLDEESGSRLREIHAGHVQSGDDDSGGRSTIIIKDLDESGTIEALPARSSGSMDPRVRARRIAVRRAKGRKRLIWVAIGAAIVLVLVGAVAILASSLFDVRTVKVQGALYTDQQLLSEIVGDLDGKAILLVDTRQIERKLESIAWVESARVSTEFPHRVFIDIRERKPIATFAGSDGKFRVIDRDGRVLDVVAGQPIDYMLVTGANPDVTQGQFSGRPFASAAQLVIALPSEIRAITNSIGVDATAGNMTMVLRGPPSGQASQGDPSLVPPRLVKVQLGTDTDMSAKLVRLLYNVRQGLDKVTALDVSTTEFTRTTIP